MIIFLRRFPWCVMLGAWICYLLTLSHGMTVNSIVLTSKVAGWDWQPMVGHPVSWLLTLPLRLLPAGWMPVALNLYSSLIAAVTLGVLARSLELLPWPRPLDELKGWKRRIPVVLALAVCGLEINFWQAATSATGEMMELLVLAVAVWCMLEFRAGKTLRWLYTAAAVWGVGMAENWMMWLTFPLFIGGLVWLRKLRFFKLGFILVIGGCVLAGFSVYAILPLANSLLPGSPWHFGEAWLISLKQTESLLLWIHSEFWKLHRAMALVALIYFVLPMLAFLPVPDEKVGAVSTLSRMDVWMLRGQRVGLLFLCVFLALNPIIGPRHIFAHEMNLSLPLLSLDYLNGLAVGFLVGKLILLHGEDFTRRRRTGWQIELRVSRAVFPVLTVILGVIVMALIVRNVRVVTQANRNSLAQFGELAWRSLPAEGGIIVSDFPEKLMVFQATQAWHTRHPQWLPVDIKALPTSEYRMRLDRMLPGLWLSPTNHHSLSPPEMVYQVAKLLGHNRVFYLHPSNGFFGETFYLEPAGSVFELKEYATNQLDLPPIPAEVITRTEKTWNDFEPQLESLERANRADSLSLAGFSQKNLLLEPVPFSQITVLGGWYSLALNGWGVDLQRNNHLPEASRRFNESVALNPENWIARANLTVNSNLLAGTEMTPVESDDLAQKVGDVGTIQKLGAELNRFGPADEPSLCLVLGTFFHGQKEPRLAFQQFSRAQALAPGALAPQFALAALFVAYRLDDQARQSIQHLRTEISGRNVNPQWDLQVSFLEAKLWLAQTNRPNARRVLDVVADKYGKQPGVLERVAETYLEYNDLTNAEPMMDTLLAAEPDDQAALLNQSRILIETGRAVAAIPMLDHLLTLTNLPAARFNRAQAYLMTKKFDAAKAEYLALQSTPVNQLLVNFNLGEIAVHEHDTNQAIRYYSVCLSNTPPGSIQWQTASNQLRALGVRGY
jgi:tetratricopeptide (TPR) repeat protein